MDARRSGGALEVGGVFLLLGCIAFGGPLAHVTLMRRMLVHRRHWLDEDTFFALFAACQLIPGPSSTELGALIGYRRAGWRGLIAASAGFIGPAVVLMLLLALLYEHAGSGHVASRVLAGIGPVVVGIIAWATVDTARRLLRSWSACVVAGAVFAAAIFLNQPIALMAGAAVLMVVLRRLRLAATLAAGTWPHAGSSTAASVIGGASLGGIALAFLKLGIVAFGSGYVLLPLLRSDLVLNLHWLTDHQVLDAVAISQATPGPVFTVATFLGYLIAGLAGGLIATLAVFLPGLLLVPALDRVSHVMRRRPLIRDALTGVNVAALGLIAAVMVSLARETLTGVEPVLAALVTLAVLLRWPLASPALVVAGGAAGLFVH